MSIYNDVEELNNTIESINNDESKSVEEKQDLINQVLQLQQETLQDGLNRLSKVKMNFESDIEGLKQEIERLTQRKKALENNIDNIKDYMLLLMQQSNLDKVKTDLFNFSIRKSKAINVIDESKIDDRFFIIKKQLNKTDLKEYLKDNTCEGAEIVENTSIIIK